MKLPNVSAIVALVRTHVANILALVRKHLFLVAGVALGIIVVIAGIVGWRHYQYRQSAAFAFQRFHAALMPPNLEILADCVDFNGLTLPLARAAARLYPFVKPGPHQVAQINDILQTALIKQVRLKNEDAPKELPDRESRLRSPLYAVPSDLLTQISTTLTLAAADESTALATATVRHQLLEKDFPLRFRLERSANGWRVRSLDNAQELVAQFREAQVERMQGQRQLLVDKNERTMKRMEQTLPLKDCTASATLLSDGQTVLLGVQVEAKNISDVVVKSVNLSATVADAKGQKLLHRYLNAVVSVLPQQPFRHSWIIELAKTSPEGRAVLAAGQLSCKAVWQTLALANGDVLHIIEVPPPLEELQ
ncbi:MAG: translation initiation factor IF-2 [Desulfovibrio sp.]|nr:translation initiation factor IF-2 [Desulfovibrio sp.]